MSGSHRDSTLCGGIRSKYDYNNFVNISSSSYQIKFKFKI